MGERAQFCDPANVALGLRSLHAYRHVTDCFGVDIGLQQVGYLFVIRHEADVARFEASVAVQNRFGVSSRIISPREAVELCPYLEVSTLAAAVRSPNDGFARPAVVVNGLAAAARDLGVQVRTGTRLVGIARVTAWEAEVGTADGARYVAPTVVCAAGAWSRVIGAMVDVELPIKPLRRQIERRRSPAGRRAFPHLDYSTTAYFHGSEDGGLLLGWADPNEPVGFDRTVTTTGTTPCRAPCRPSPGHRRSADLTRLGRPLRDESGVQRTHR